MKRIIAILMAALLIVAMAIPVFADEAATGEAETTSSAGEFAYDAESGTIKGSYEAEGLVEIWMDGKLAGSDSINKPAEVGTTHTIDVYVDGVKVGDTYTVEAVAPVEEPTEEPKEEPTEEPKEEPTEEPKEEPTEEPKEEPTPTAPTDKTDDKTTDTTQKPAKADTTKAAATNVPKTGDAENMGTFMVLGLAAALTLVAAKRIKSR